MKKLDIIKKRLAKYEDKNTVHEAMLKRQGKLQWLVLQHGAKAVSLAGGYTESTLNQYIRSNSPNIGKENLDKAIHILKNL